MTRYRFLIVIEKAGKNYSAYSPDLPGCVATGKTREEAEERMHEAIRMHNHEPVEIKRSVLAVRSGQVKENVRNNKCRCGTAKDLLDDLSSREAQSG
jgi:predicted RNase H-like HicB family nuclease